MCLSIFSHYDSLMTHYIHSSEVVSGYHSIMEKPMEVFMDE